MKPRFGSVCLLGAAMVVAMLTAGCASGKNKVSPAGTHVTAVEKVLATMGDGVARGDVDALAALWVDTERDAARARILAGLQGIRAKQLKVTLAGVRVEGDQVIAQAIWRGSVDGEPVSGRFGLRLSGTDALLIDVAAGELPWAVGGRGDALSADWPVSISQ